MNQIPTAIFSKRTSEQGMLLDRCADLCCLCLISPRQVLRLTFKSKWVEETD